MSVRVRYAPSPTGFPHIGNLRAAVYSYLFAKHQGGTFMLRVEDTDQGRAVEGATEYIIQSLQWLGILPDEGVCLAADGTLSENGPFGPYTQSKRLVLYKERAEQLVASGHAYRCFCTPERLEKLRQDQQVAKLPPKYDRHCRALAPEEVQKRVDAGEAYVIRHAIPDGQTVVLDDIVRGHIEWNSNDLDDYVLLKSDGFPTYQLANVVDDHAMEISHVLRGEEWVPSAPKNILLYQAFGWELPQFAHLPVILGPDKQRKLSKRDGADPILTLRDRGYLADAVINYMTFLGWSPGTEEEFFSHDELVERFDLTRVQKAPAVFDQVRLDYMNGWYIRRLPVGEVAERMLPFLQAAGLVVDAHPVEAILHQGSFAEYRLLVAGAVQERLKHFDESEVVTWFFFKRPLITGELRALIVPKKGDSETTLGILREVISVLEALPANQWTHDGLSENLGVFIGVKAYRNGDVLWPVRAALTGSAASPGAYEMLVILGREESLLRLKLLIN